MVNNKGLFALLAVTLIFASHVMMMSLYFHATEQGLEAKRMHTVRQKTLDSLVNQKPQRQLPPVTILYYAPVSRWLGKHMLNSPPRCPMVNCTFTEARNKISESQAVVFHIPTHSDGLVPSKSFPSQKFVAFSMESEEYYTSLKNEKFMNKFDWKMTYHLDSDIIAAYFSSNLTWFMTPPLEKRETSALALFVASNCSPLNNRGEYVEELMKYISIHSYGRCLHNKDFPPKEEGQSGGKQKFETMRKYKFYLAFENHSAKDYVSEKFFHSLGAGAVPVYMGAPNIDEFSPSSHSVIKVSDFNSAKELADYLKYLDENDEEYQKYLEWKRVGPSEQFKNLLKRQELDARCRLCIKAAETAAENKPHIL